MVLFHVVVNLSNFVFDQHYFYFIALGFVMFLGVVCGKFLHGRSSKKLAIAGKLLGIFLVFNGYKFFADDFAVRDLLFGNQGFFSFEILLPMAFTLFLCVLFDRVKTCFGALAFMVFAILCALFYFDIYFYNLNYTLYGLFGYFLSRGLDLNLLSDRFHENVMFPLLCFLFLAASFLSIFYFGLVDVVILLQVFCMYFLVKIFFGNNKFLFVLGRHSLIIYVAHIVLIKVIKLIFYA